MNLSIITPIRRPENLPVIAKSLGTDLFEIEWYCVYDRIEPKRFDYGDVSLFTIVWHSGVDDIYGATQRNKAFDYIHDGFVCFLDDDNIIHPDFFKILRGEIESNPDKLAFLFTAIYKTGQVYCRLDEDFSNVIPDSIDTSQFVISRDLIGSTKWRNLYNGDGYFIYDIFNKHPEKFKNTQGLVYYNYLR